MKTTKRRHSLKRISFLTIGLTLAFFVGISTAISLFNMFNILDQSELDHMQLNGNIVSGVLKAFTANNQSITREWSSLDETYSFAVGERRKIGDIISEHQLMLYGFDFVVIKDMSGSDLYVRFYDREAEADVSAPQGFTDYLGHAAAEMQKSYVLAGDTGLGGEIGRDGFFFYEGLCYYVCAMPVLPSDEEAEPAGSFIFGRFMTEDDMNRIGGLDYLPFTLLDISSQDIKGRGIDLSKGEAYNLKSDTFTYYKTFTDYFGDDSIVISIRLSRSLREDGLRDIRLSTVGIGVIMLLLLAAIAYLLSWFILRPLGRLIGDVESITDSTASIDSREYGDSLEFYKLSGAITDMLGRLTQSRINLEESTVSINTLTSILNGLDVNLHVTDPQTNEILFINDKVKRELNVGDEIIGEKCWKILQEDKTEICEFCNVSKLMINPDEPIVWEDMNEASGKCYQKTDSIITWMDGRQVHMQNAVDISKLKQAELSLKQAISIAESASNAKSDFLSRMSHEMRTPMNAIIGMTNIAKSTHDISKKEYCLDKIGDASKQLLGVINDILDMSKIEANKLELLSQEFDFEKMLISINNVVGIKADEKKQNLYFHIDENIPHNMIGDEQRLSQVIINLLSNAIKFTPDTGKVTLIASMVDLMGEPSEGDAFDLRIEVSDTGIGISQGQQERLFNSFEQADGSISRKYGGTGLGLSISKKIVERMNGRIWVESKPDEGARFIFTVRLIKGKNRPKQKLEKSTDRSELRILAVDDSSETRDFFVHVMGGLGLNCDVAADGYEAIYMIKNAGEKPYNMFFVDWMMPDMDGIELTRHIRRMTDDKVVILLISVAEWGDIEGRAMSAGVSRFLSKPLFPSTVMNAISEAMGIVPENSIKKDSGRKYNFKGHTILLAEDVDVNREIIYAVLEDTGAVIDEAENGAEAISKFEIKQGRYSLILMDVQMPEVDGYEASKRIRALPNGSTIPIVAMTANVFREDVERCLKAGMDDHIGKPIDNDVLLEKLERYLQRTGKEDSVGKNEGGRMSDETNDYSVYLPAIAVEDALRRLMNKKKLYFTMLKNFAGRKMVDDLIESIQSGDSGKITSTAHALKGVSSNLGLMELNDVAAAIEVRAKSGMECADLTDSLSKTLEETMGGINNLIESEGDL